MLLKNFIYVFIISLSFIAALPAEAEVNRNELNIVINNIKDDLFSSSFNGGHELESFIEAGKNDLDNVDSINDNLLVFSQDDSYLVIFQDQGVKRIFEVHDSLKYVPMGNKAFFRGDINNFLIPAREESDDVIRYAWQKYKLFFPYTKSAIISKKYWNIFDAENNNLGYLITPEHFTQEDARVLLAVETGWEQKISLSFISKINSRKHKFVMIGNDPFDAIKTQRMLKQVSKPLPRESLLKLSFGNLFSMDRKVLNNLEVENFRNNRYQAVLPSYRDLLINEEKLKELTNITPLIAANFSHKEKDLFKTHTVVNINGRDIAVTGVIDDFLPKARGTVSKVSPFQFLETSESLEKILVELLNDNKIDLVIVMNNIISSKEKYEEVKKVVTDNINKYPQKQVIFLSLNIENSFITRSESSEKNFNFSSPELFLDFPLSRAIHKLKINYHENYISGITLESISNLTKAYSKVFDDKELEKTMLEARSTMISEVQDFASSSPTDTDIMLPDIREVRKFIKNTGSLDLEVYDSDVLALLFSSIMLDSFNAELAVTRNSYGTGTTIGKINKSFVKEWLNAENDRIIVLNLSGTEINNLIDLNKKLKIFDESGLLFFNGVNADKNLIRNRQIKAEELYRVVTTEDIFNNLLLQDIFTRASNAEVKEKRVNDFIYNYFESLLKKHNFEKNNDFSNAYYLEFSGLFEEKSEQLNPLWLISLPKLQLNYNRNQINGNEEYTQVKDSRVNTPNSYDLGFSGKLSAMYDTHTFNWENSLSAIFEQSFIELREDNLIRNIERKGNDDITASTDLKLKFISINLQEQSLSLIPFLRTSYSTEFKPTVNPETNIENRRRSELNNSVGLVFYPVILDEIRIGFSGRSDFSARPPGLFNPGWFASFIGNYPFGNYLFTIEGNYRYFFPSANEDITQLSAYGDFNSSLSVPIFEKIKLSFNINAFMFKGNGELRNQPFGYGLNAFVGLGYSFNLKPFYGSYF